MPEASCLSVQGLRKWLQEIVQTCASIVRSQTMLIPVNVTRDATEASWVTFTKPMSGRNVRIICKI